MISLKESFPTRSKSALLAQDILWTQFNDVNFYVEDVDQQNFYLQTLKKIFPDIKINRIFPLGGKTNVIAEAKKHRSRKKIFLLDLDFDDILGKKIDRPNLFYLDKYSIENYLLEENAIFELVKEENPKMTNAIIKSRFSLSQFHKDCYNLFGKLSCNFLLINKYELGLDYLGIEPHRDCECTSSNWHIKNSALHPYFSQIEASLRFTKPRLKYRTQIAKHQRFFNTIEKCIKNVPGKYLLNFLKFRLKKLFRISQTTLDSFTYRLMKNCNFLELQSLRTSITNFIQK